MARQLKPRGKARFFCEQCGAEVRPGASSCPSCGSLFTAVRCPECGHEGRAPEFRAGCPVCGYAALGGEESLAERPPAPPPKTRRGMPVVFSRIALLVLSVLFVVLVLVLILHG
jgi:uncharacterized membrane protein YvbJ